MRFIYNNRYKSGGVFLVVVFILAVILIGVVSFSKQKTVCDSTLKYSIGSIDSRFDISKPELIKLAYGAEKVWEEGTGIDLFKYSPNSKFKINLIFDKRQQTTNTEKKSRENLDKNNTEYSKLKQKYEVLKSLHDDLYRQYRDSVNSYENKLKEYNKQVAYWNSVGGAPQYEFSKLQQQSLNLKNIVVSLNSKTDRLNNTNKKMNIVVGEINNFAKEINTDVSVYNNKYSKSVIFDQGEYTGKRINIYQFDNTKDLRVVIAHEFGHAIGLNHVQNPKSIMYYLMKKQDVNNPVLSKEDTGALKTECEIK